MVIIKERASSATAVGVDADKSLNLRYCAILTRPVVGQTGPRMGQQKLMATGEAKDTVADTLSSLLDAVASELYQAKNVLSLNYDKLFDSRHSQAQT